MREERQPARAGRGESIGMHVLVVGGGAAGMMASHSGGQGRGPGNAIRAE